MVLVVNVTEEQKHSQKEKPLLYTGCRGKKKKKKKEL